MHLHTALIFSYLLPPHSPLSDIITTMFLIISYNRFGVDLCQI
nr:MAG TPA: hypothetical protein [Caudoviricetes sp.]